MKKPIVIKAEIKGWRPMLVVGAVLAAIFALLDMHSAMSAALAVFTAPLYLHFGKRLVFGQKFLSIRSRISEEQLINYKNIKAIVEKNEVHKASKDRLL